MRLVLATSNAGKLSEMRRLLHELPVRVSSITSVLGHCPEVEETGGTFAANAELKARAACDSTGLMALADDSGLEVDALGGQPGVRSRRFAGEEASDADNNALLLRKLAHTPEPERTARFRCVIALATPSGGLHCVAGTSEGVILNAPRGRGGFGYDPLFSPLGLGGVSFAELEPEQKDALSHRGQALRKLRLLLLDQLASR